MPNTDNMLENMLLLQYLSNAGGAMSAGQPVGPALNQVTQQNISSRNFMKLLQKMLAGEVPDGGKLTMDKDGMKINVPKTAMGGGLDLARQGSGLPGGSGINWTESNIPRTLNPFL